MDGLSWDSESERRKWRLQRRKSDNLTSFFELARQNTLATFAMMRSDRKYPCYHGLSI